MRTCGIGKVQNVVSQQYALLAKGTFQSTLHNIQRYHWKIQYGGRWHVHFEEFMTIFLQT